MKKNVSRYTYNEYENILINKEGLTTQTELNDFEAIQTFRRLSELALRDEITGNFNIEHLKGIHSYIFQDVYLSESEMEKSNHRGKLAFRGTFRIENIAKGNFNFANAMYIDQSLRYILDVELKKDNYLIGLPLDTFVKKVSYYLAELNVIHPFREGNGRSTREFIRQLSQNAGYHLDWSLLEGKTDEFMDAMIASVSSTSKLEEIMSSIIK